MFDFTFIRILFSLSFVVFLLIVSDLYLLNKLSTFDSYDHIHTLWRNGKYGGETSFLVTEKGEAFKLPDGWNYYFDEHQSLKINYSRIFKRPVTVETSQNTKQISIPVNSLNKSLVVPIMMICAAIVYLITIIQLLIKKIPNDIIGIAAIFLGSACLFLYYY